MVEILQGSLNFYLIGFFDVFVVFRIMAFITLTEVLPVTFIILDLEKIVTRIFRRKKG